MQAAVGTTSSLTFGSALDGFFNDVDSTIQQAVQEVKNAVIEAEITAAREIELLIESTKEAYKDSLNYTIDKLSKKTKDTFDQISSLVQEFQEGTAEQMSDLKARAQQLANTLPFAKAQTQLTSVTPRFLVVDDVAKSSLITFKGNFPSSATKGFEPSLTFANKTCYLVDLTTQSMIFEVPNNVLVKEAKDEYGVVTGMLSAPWNDAYTRFHSHKAEANYRIGLNTLPQLAGKGSVEYVGSQTVQDKEHNKVNKGFNGNNWYPEHWHTEHWSIFPPEGWRIDVTSPKLTSHHEHGDHNEKILSVSAKEIVVEVNLYCKDGHSIGIVTVDVDYDLIRDRTEETKRTENFEMNWKDSMLLEPNSQANEVISSVKFDEYTGAHKEFGGPDLNSSVLKVAAEGNGKWKIWAEPPKEMSMTLADMPKTAEADVKDLEKIVARLQKFAHLSNLPAEIKMHIKPHSVLAVNAANSISVENATSTESPTAVETTNFNDSASSSIPVESNTSTESPTLVSVETTDANKSTDSITVEQTVRESQNSAEVNSVNA